MALRDGCPADPAHADNERYVGAHRTHEATCDPVTHADLVLDATRWDDLTVLRGWSGPG